MLLQNAVGKATLKIPVWDTPDISYYTVTTQLSLTDGHVMTVKLFVLS